MIPFLSGINDLMNTHYPYYILLKREILENHRFPFFNPLIFGGINLLGDPQNGIFYPFTYLYLFLNFNFATIFILLLHFIILFVGTFFLFRKIFKAEKWIAIFLGLLFVLLPKWSYHIVAGHLSMIESLSWFPIIFYFILKITVKEYVFSKKDFVLFSFFCCLSIFANYFFFYQIALFVGAYLILWIIGKIINKKVIEVKPVIKLMFLSLLLIFLVTAIQIVPGLTAMRNLTHVNLSLRDTIPFWSFRYLFQGLFFPWRNLIKFDQEAFLYSGILFYVLAIGGMIKSWGQTPSIGGQARSVPTIKILFVLLVAFSIFILNYRFPFYGIFIKFIPSAATLRVTTRFWFFLYFILLIFFLRFINMLKQEGKLWLVLVSIILVEYISIDLIKLKSPNVYGDQKETKIYSYLAKNYKNQKIYTTEAFLSQYFTAKYNIWLAAGENPWQNADYIKKLKKAGGYSWFKEYAVIYPPWQAIEQKSQPNAKLLRELKVQVVLSNYSLTDKNFQYMTTIDKIKVYENKSGFPLSRE